MVWSWGMRGDLQAEWAALVRPTGLEAALLMGGGAAGPAPPWHSDSPRGSGDLEN